MSSQEIEKPRTTNECMPHSWIKSKLNELCILVPTGVEKFIGEIEYFSTGAIKKNSVTPEGIYNFENRPLRANRISKFKDIFQARMRGSEKALLVNDFFTNKLFSTGFIHLRCYDCFDMSKFLYYYIQSPQFLSQRDAYSTGTTQVALTDNGFSKIILQVPPLNEQNRIISKIEVMLSIIDSTEKTLKVNHTQWKMYEKSIMETAFHGNLTKTWREKNQPKSVSTIINEIKNQKKGNEKREPTVISLQGLHYIPNQWVWTNLAELKKFSHYGPRYSSNDYSNSGCAVLRTTDINETGKVDFVKSPKLKLSENELKKHQCEIGDILFTRTGNTIGTLAVFNDDIIAIPGAYLIQYRLMDLVKNSSWYLYYFFKSITGQNYLKKMTAGVGVPNINGPKIDSIPIPFAPLIEQNEIVNSLRLFLSDIYHQKNTIIKNLKLLSNFRYYTLQLAFEGKLVPQDPKDEPAEILLQKIKQEKEQLIQKQKTSRRKKNVK